MVTLSFSWMIIIVVLMFTSALDLLAFFKSPWRKWICFGLASVSIVYLLYIMLWSPGLSDNQRFNWLLIGVVGIMASFGLVGIGIMDMESSMVVANGIPQTVCNDLTPDGNTGNEIEKQDESEERTHQNELFGRVIPWLKWELGQYDKLEQDAIMTCAEKFILENQVCSPSVTIKKNRLYSQQRLQSISSAFLLLGKDRSECAYFAKTVFPESFSNTIISTLEKKIMGRDKIQLTIDDYWDSVR